MIAYSISLVLLVVVLVAIGWHLRGWLEPQPSSPRASSKHLAAVERRLNMKISELNEKLDGLVTELQSAGDQLEKAKGEILTALTNVDLPPETTAKIEALGGIAAALKAASQELDDINPDVIEPAAPAAEEAKS